MPGRSNRFRRGKGRIHGEDPSNNDTVGPRNDTQVSSEPAPRRRKPLWQTIYGDYLAVHLDNSKGSVARDHLANERTYLAWLRTSLSFASAGVGVTQLLRLDTTNEHNRESHKVGRLRKVGKPAGALMVFIALLVIIFGAIRYFRVQAAMQKGLFPASRILIGFLSLATFLILVAGFAFLLIYNSAGAPL